MSGDGYLSRRAARLRRQKPHQDAEAEGADPSADAAAAAAYSAAAPPVPEPGIRDFNECQEAVKRLTEYLSHELRPDEAAQIEEHLSQCRGCFSRFHFEETLLHTIRERAQTVRAPAHLRQSLMAMLKKAEE